MIEKTTILSNLLIPKQLPIYIFVGVIAVLLVASFAIIVILHIIATKRAKSREETPAGIFLRFFDNYAPAHFKYWREHSVGTYKAGLTKVLAALGCLTLGVALSLVVLLFSLWWLGAILLAGVLCIAAANIAGFHKFAYYNAWELGKENADIDELVAIANERYRSHSEAMLTAAEARTDVHRRSSRHPNRIRESKTDIALNIVNLTMLFAGLVLICFPLLNYFSLAFNNGNFNTHVVIFPVRPTFKAMEYVLAGKDAEGFWRSFLNSVIITGTVTIGSNLMMALAAYPLSKRDCPLRGGILMYFVITMLFSAGIVPIYLLMSVLNLLDNILSIILISLSNVANMLYFKTFFEGISTDIEEAAKLDGASDLQLFFLIVVPMSLPIIGTCCFFTIVGTWNSYGTALLFIRSGATNAQPLAYYLYLMLNSKSGEQGAGNEWLQSNMPNREAAAMFASIVPIILMYPFVVKYIKGGLQLGSVKG